MDELSKRELLSVFTQCDHDKNGYLQPQELLQVVRSLAGWEPTRQELFELMTFFDKDSDGRVSFAELAEALSKFLADHNEDLDVDMAGNANTPANHFANFFQDQRSQHRETIRNRLARAFLVFREGDTGSALLHNDATDRDPPETGNYCFYFSSEKPDSAERLQVVQQTMRLLKQVHEIAALPNGGGMRWLTSPESRLQCARTLVEMLRIVNAFRSPMDRLEVRELVNAVFDEIAHTTVMQQMSNYLTLPFQPLPPSPQQPQQPTASSPPPPPPSVDERMQLCRLALEFFSLIADGPRIANQPEAASQLFKDYMVRAGVVPRLLRLLQDNTVKMPVEIRGLAVRTVGTLALHDSQSRYLLLANGCFGTLVRFVDARVPVEHLRGILRSVAILSGESHQTRLNFPKRLKQLALPKLVPLLFHCEDAESLVHCLAALCYLLPGISINKGRDAIYERLLVLLRDNDNPVLKRVVLKLMVHLLICEDPKMNFGPLERYVPSLVALCGNLMNTTKDAWTRLHICQIYGSISLQIRALPMLIENISPFAEEHRKAEDIGEALDRLYLDKPAPGKPAAVPAPISRPRPAPAKVSTPSTSTTMPGALQLAAAASEELPPLKLPESPGSPTLKLVGQRSVGWHRHRYVGDDEDEDDAADLEPLRLPPQSHADEFLGKQGAEAVGHEEQQQRRRRKSSKADRSLLDERGGIYVHDWEDKMPAAGSEEGANITLYRQMSSHVPQLIPSISSFSPQLRPRVLPSASSAAGTAGDEASSEGSAAPVLLRGKSLIPNLAQNTHLSERQLEHLYAELKAAMKHAFKEEVVLDSGETKTRFRRGLDQEEFGQVLRSHGVNDEMMVRHLFLSFDVDKNGSVDFQEVAVGLSVMFGGSLEDRLKLAFRAYDLDADDSISFLEYAAIMKASFLARGFDFSDEMVHDICNVSFQRIDKDNNGSLNYEEFRNAVLSSEMGLQLFWKSSLTLDA